MQAVPLSVPEPDYRGQAGLEQLQALHRELDAALQAGDWLRVRRLDRACGGLVARLVAVNEGSSDADLVAALKDLKHLYARLLQDCQQQVMRMAL